MIAMLLVPDTTLRSLGLGAVIVGLVSIVVALTFHPAMLMVLGDRVDRLRVPWLGRRVAASAGEEGPLWRRAVLARHAPSGDQPDRHHRRCCWRSPPRCSACRWAPPGRRRCRTTRVAKQGLVALQRDFPSGATDPVNIVVDGSPNDAGVRQGLTRLRAQLAGDRDFAARALTVAERAARSPWRPCRSPSSRAASARRRPSTACATTTCRPRSAPPRTACSSAARRPRRATRSRSTPAGCRS